MEVGTAEKPLKARTPNGAIWRNLKIYFWSWNCKETLKIDAKRCILMQKPSYESWITSMFFFNNLTNYVFMSEPLHSFVLPFSHLNVTHFMAFNSKVYSNEYATLRAWLLYREFVLFSLPNMVKVHNIVFSKHLYYHYKTHKTYTKSAQKCGLNVMYNSYVEKKHRRVTGLPTLTC